MGRVFHGTMPSIRRPHEITSRVAFVVCGLLLCASCGMSASPPYLTTYQQSAMEGAEFTLSCTTTHSGGFINIIWYRNNADIFQTTSDVNQSTSIFTPNTTSPQYQSVSGRVTVSASLQQHNVTLRINSTLDQGSVWRCKSGKDLSNNVTLEITDISEGPPSTDHTLTTTPDKTAPTKTSISGKATRSPIKDGQILTLTCESTNDIIEAVWSRNSVNIIKTILPTSMFVYNTISPQYQSVSGRVTVSSSLQQHNVTLRINSTLDQGSVWRCHTGNIFSNNVTIDVVPDIQDRVSDESTIILTVAVASIIVVIVVVVASFVSVLVVRKYKKDVAESNSQMYSTMSRDPDADNKYSELGPGLINERLPTSQPVATEESAAYYNTVASDSQYENPPTSTAKPNSPYSE